MNANAESPYMDSYEAMHYLRINTLSNLYNLITRWHLPTQRRGRRLMFDKREVDAWLRGMDALELRRLQRRSA